MHSTRKAHKLVTVHILTAKISSSVTASARCSVEELRLMVFWMSLMSAVILSMSLFCFTVVMVMAVVMING